MQYGIRDATKVIFLTSPDGGTTWEPSTEFAPLTLDEPVTYGERDAERVVILTSLDGGTTWVPAEPGGLSEGPWSTWFPALDATVTTPTIGVGGIVSGRYQTLGNVVVAEGRIVWGGTGT